MIVASYASVFVVLGLAFDRPGEIARVIAAVLASRDTLLTDYFLFTDYFGIAGIGATLVHTGILTLLACALYQHVRAPVTGASMACLLLLLGFGLFGKNLVNVWFILAGVWMYARFRGEPFAQPINRRSSEPRWNLSSQRSCSALFCLVLSVFLWPWAPAS
jgi:hypothetical protein